MYSRATFLMAVTALVAAADSVNAQRIYWTGDGGVRRAYLDGSSAEFVIPTLGLALALDLEDGKIYFWGALGKIQRANLDGSGIEDVVTSNVHAVFDIELDLLHRKIYWLDGWNIQGSPVSGVLRADLDDGADPEPVLGYESESSIYGIALDPQAQYLYWTTSFDAILRRSFGGPPTEELITEGLDVPYGIALDTRRGKIYWAQFFGNRISQANLDGSQAGAVLESAECLGQPVNVALDLVRDKLYWTDTRNSTICRVNFDGTAAQAIFPQQTYNPYGIAVDDRVYFDCDTTGQADLSDQRVLVDCLAGPGTETTITCLCADENGDRDVDLQDFAAFQRIVGAE